MGEGLYPRRCPSGKGYWGYKPLQVPEQKGTSEVSSNSTRQVVVEGGGRQVVAHVGLHALGQFADRLGLGESLSRVRPVG